MKPEQLENIQSDILKDYSLNNVQTLEDEVKIINDAATKVGAINKTLTEIHTENWHKLGMLLTEHMNHVIKRKGNVWKVWATEKFSPLIKEKRRQQCMALVRYGKNVDRYYYMGIDRIYDLFNKLDDCSKFNKVEFEYATKRFGFVFEIEPQTDEEKAHLNKSADLIIEFFKFIRNVKHKKYDKELVADTIVSGGTFNKKDFEELNDPSKTKSDIQKHLIKMIATGSSSATSSPSQRSPESIQVLLTKIIQTVDKYLSSNEWPEYLEDELVDEAINKLAILKKSI